jgi:DUF917 family protein
MRGKGMPTKELKSETDVKDFVRGCTFLGTGGGGSPEEGVSLLIETLDSGKKIHWVDVNEVDDEAWVTSPAGMGSIAPVTVEKRRMFEQLGLKERKVKRMLVEAVRELELYLGSNVDIIVPAEIGGGNTPVPLDTAAQLGKLTVDGDYTGRAIPEVEQCLPAMHNKKITPIACVDDWGNVSIVKDVVTLAVAERLGKMISTIATGLCGETFFTMKAKEMKELLVPGTLTESLEIGKAIRVAGESGKDPVEAVTDFLSGWVLFKGRVEKKDWEDREGYMFGTTYIKGSGIFQGQEFKIWFKNENHISWKNEKPFVTSPDIIEVVELETAEPITNPSLQVGQNVAVIGVRARKQYATKRGIELLGPSHYGFDIEHTPIEKMQ